jgi:energy-coupling factor transport system substrate-specific component
VDTRKVAVIAVFASMVTAFRVAKNLVTAVQFINLPLSLAFTASLIFGGEIGFAVGFLGYLLSDLLIYPGPWTVVNSIVAGALSYLLGVLPGSSRQRIIVFATTFLLCLLFDIVTSALLYIILGLEPARALIIGIVGLFLPVMGGYLLGVGPVTELSTALLTTFLVEALKRIPTHLYSSPS